MVPALEAIIVGRQRWGGGVVHRQWEFMGGFIVDLLYVNFLDINNLTAKSVPAGTKN
jgi:hypothetical protein